VGTDRYQIIQHSDYPTIPTLNNIMKAIFYYCSYTCTLQIIIAVFHFYICFWLRVIRFLSFLGGVLGNLLSYYSDAERPADCGSGVNIAEKLMEKM